MLKIVRTAIRNLGREAIIRNAAWLTLGQGASLVFQMMTFIALARLLGSLQYGVFVGAFAFTGIIAQYSSVGTGTIFIRYVSGTNSQFHKYWGNILAVTSGSGLLIVAALTLIGHHILNPASASIVLAAAIANCYFAQLTTECSRVFQAFEQMKITALLGLVTNAIRACAALSMLISLRHATAAAWSLVALVISGISSGAAVWLISIRFGRPSFSLSTAKKHAAEGFGYAFATSTAAVYNDIDKTLLSHYGMNAANGVYSMAYRVVDVATVPLFALREALLPRLFKLGHSGVNETARLSMRFLKGSLPLGFAVAGGMYVTAPLIPRLLGVEFIMGVSALRWLCWIPVFRSVHHITGSALTGSGYQAYRTCTQVCAAVLNLILNLWLIPRYGWKGAAWASLVTDGMLAVACWGLLQITRSLVHSKFAKDNSDDRLHVVC